MKHLQTRVNEMVDDWLKLKLAASPPSEQVALQNRAKWIKERFFHVAFVWRGKSLAEIYDALDDVLARE